MRRGGDRSHEITELRRSEQPLLVGRLAGGQEHHLVQPELDQGLLGSDQMGDMDGVERPAHDAQTQAAPRAQSRYRIGLVHAFVLIFLLRALS